MSSIIRSSRPCAACLRRIQASRSLLHSTNAIPRTTKISSTSSSASNRSATKSSDINTRLFSTSRRYEAKATDITTKKRSVAMGEFPPERIRNLSIIAHIDHGKSTLADRLLQMTGTVPQSSNPQFLDKLKVERERGITVKAQTVSIIHTHTDGQRYLINLIDTPGHVDFSYEVSRSLGACEGGLLLVDCSQGIQAQTLSVFHHALEANLKLLPVINKVDLPHASPEETSEEIENSLGLPIKDHMRISAKSGLGVDGVLSNIIENLPSPKKWNNGDEDGKLRGLIFDTFYDQFRGVVSLVRIFSGTLKKGDKVRFLQAGKRYEILEVGINNPEEVVVDELRDGQVGYIVCNMKNSEEAFIGDTICWADKPVEPLPGFKPMKAMVYAGVFPMDSSDFPKLEESIERLTLNDRSVSIQRESSAALSQGFRLGFLGTLHMDVFKQRLEDEYSSEVIVTAPTVPYKVVYLDGSEEFVSNPVDFPEVTDSKLRVRHIEEPMINATIFVPNEYIGEMMDLCSRYRGVQQEYRILENSDRAILRYTLPLAEIVTDFFSELKSSSSGFASFDYEEAGYQQSNLVKLNILINTKPVDALAMIVHKFAAQSVGKAWVKKLKEVVPRQQFELSLQAAVGAKVIARENVSAFRKDVTAGLYGGHYDRKLKHLNKQKEGKKRLKRLAESPIIPESLSPTPRPIGRSSIPPPERSSKLSSIGRMTTFPPPADSTSSQLSEAFQDLSSSSPDSHVFTPGEIHEIITSLRIMQKREGGDRKIASQQLDPLFQELREIIGSSSKSTENKGLELSILSSLSRTERKVKTKDIISTEKQFKQIFPCPPSEDDIKGIERYKGGINYLMYLCGLAGHESRLEDWWNKFKRDGLKPDSYSYLSKLILLDKLNKLDDFSNILNEALNQDGLTQEDITVLVNFSIHAFARNGYFDIAIKACSKLVELEHDDLHNLIESSNSYSLSDEPRPRSLEGYEIPIPTGTKVTKELFGPLLSSFVNQGNLLSSLIIFKHIFENDFTPNLKDYITLFKGFSIYGEIPKDGEIGGEVSRVFGIDHYHSNTLRRNGQKMNRTEDNFTEIWERGLSTQEYYADPPTKSFTSTSNGDDIKWTLETLQEIYLSFLTLHFPSSPSSSSSDGYGGRVKKMIKEKQGIRGLNKKSFWLILKAFAITSGGDKLVIQKVWKELESKFGEGNDQGWKGWRVDNRLEWARNILFGKD